MREQGSSDTIQGGMDMSMIQTEISLTAKTAQDRSEMAHSEDLAMLDRYLSILENNKVASRFVPDDAMLALDMADTARRNLCGVHDKGGLSTGRLALSLVQPGWTHPTQ